MTTYKIFRRSRTRKPYKKIDMRSFIDEAQLIKLAVTTYWKNREIERKI